MRFLRCEPPRGSLRASGSRSDDQRLFRGVAGICTEVFDACFILAAEIIKAKTVFFLVHDRKQLMLKLPALGGIEQAFEDGILHALAVIGARGPTRASLLRTGV